MKLIPSTVRTRLIFSVAVLFAGLASAQTERSSSLDTAQRKQIDNIAQQSLADTGVPSVSLAIVLDGKIAYTQAYGKARLDPVLVARLEMRYSVGSISKQFTAAAILLLAEEGKLSLDDPVSRFVPDLTRANEVTIRQLLSHTSGYQDYWPQDYVPPFMLQATTAQQILDLWAHKPLDFEPGTRWQYSNTNFVIAGLIVEKASGMPLIQFLQEKIFTPLGMSSITNVDQERLTESDPTGYRRFALGPPRVAPKEGKGWLFAAGELAMTAEDLARWDISLMNESVLKPASYRELETEIRLKNGLGTHYGLGLDVESSAGHRLLAHGGEVSGFTAENNVFPDDHAAIVVLSNQDAAQAASRIVKQIAPLLVTGEKPASAEKLQRDRKILEGLQQETLDRSLFTENANSYFTDQAIQDFADGLQPLGKLASFLQTRQTDRGGMTLHVYVAKFPKQIVTLLVREMPNGKIEQYQVMAGE